MSWGARPSRGGGWGGGGTLVGGGTWVGRRCPEGKGVPVVLRIPGEEGVAVWGVFRILTSRSSNFLLCMMLLSVVRSSARQKPQTCTGVSLEYPAVGFNEDTDGG